MYTASCVFFFFFNDTATTEIYTLSLHDALPIYGDDPAGLGQGGHDFSHSLDRHVGAVEHDQRPSRAVCLVVHLQDRKSTRLNSSHANISYAVFCLKKKKKKNIVLLTITK